MDPIIDTPEPQAPELSELPDGGDDYFSNIVKSIESGNLDTPEPEPDPKPPAVKPDEEKPPEPDPKPDDAPKDELDEIEAPANMSKKASEHWEQLKTTSRNYKEKALAAEAAIVEKETNWNTEREELLRKVEEASATSGELVELRERREAFEAAEKEFSVYSVERTAEFQNTILKPLKAIDERLETISKASGASFDKLVEAIQEPDYAKQQELLEAVLPELSQVQGLNLVRMAEDARVLLDRRAEILENAQAAQKELKEKSERETAAQREAATKEYKASVKNTVESLVQRLPFVELADGETKEGVFKSILDKAEAEDFDKATPATKGTAAVAVIALERATRQLQKQTEYIATLEARVKEAATAAPSLESNTPKPPAPKQDGDLMDGVRDFLKLQRSYTILDSVV